MWHPLPADLANFSFIPHTIPTAMHLPFLEAVNISIYLYLYIIELFWARRELPPFSCLHFSRLLFNQTKAETCLRKKQRRSVSPSRGENSPHLKKIKKINGHVMETAGKILVQDLIIIILL